SFSRKPASASAATPTRAGATAWTPCCGATCSKRTGAARLKPAGGRARMDATPERTQAAADAAGQPAPTLRVRGLSYAYGKAKVLDDVALDVHPGRVTALLGPNGAGKTTLFSLVTGLFDSRQGEIEIAGHPLRRARSRALAALGIVFQAQTLDLDLTVEQNLRYFAALR